MSVAFLQRFTEEHQCWEMSYAQVVVELVKPATEEFNCAFTQLVRTRPPPENVPRFIEHATPS